VKRLILVALAAAGAAMWWRRRSAPEVGTLSGVQAIPSSSDISTQPPALGGDVDPELLAILVCPLDKQPVIREGNYLVCQECQRHYPIRDGIPVMLIDEALTPEQARLTPS
jgi:uncharacterized protein